jgi:hypothetical protein
MHGHGDKPFLCNHEGCERAVPGNGFPRQWNLKDHMRRVHNDNGSSQPNVASSSPPPSGANTAQQSSKSRKRKKDIPETGPPATSSRKTSVKVMPATDTAITANNTSKPLIDEWVQHHKALKDIVGKLANPEDALNAQTIQDAQGLLAAMGKITGVLSKLKPAVMPTQYRRTFAQTG